MALDVIAGPGADVEEPDWPALIPDREDGQAPALRQRAHREWVRITAALRSAETLADVNGRQVQRLVLAYLRYDLAAAEVLRLGAVVAAPKTKTPMLSIWQVEMRAADGDAHALEMELCLNPRRRNSAGKVQRKAKRATAADHYLKRASAAG